MELSIDYGKKNDKWVMVLVDCKTGDLIFSLHFTEGIEQLAAIAFELVRSMAEDERVIICCDQGTVWRKNAVQESAKEYGIKLRMGSVQDEAMLMASKVLKNEIEKSEDA